MTSGEANQPGSRDPSFMRPYLGGGGSEWAPGSQDMPEVRRASGVRPYLLTGGRAGPVDAGLEIEAQMATTSVGRAMVDRLAFEQHDIVVFCQNPTAIAEIAAQLNLHLGVARVLVGDLIANGYLTARRPEVGLDRNTSIIERVIRGLQAIR